MTPKTFYSLFLLMMLAPALILAQPNPGAATPVPPATPAPPVAASEKVQVSRRQPTQLGTTNMPIRPGMPAMPMPGSTPSSGPGTARLPASLRSGGISNAPAGRMPSPTSIPATLAPGDAKSTNITAASTTTADGEQFFNFVNIPLEQVLEIYSDLIGRTLLRANTGVDGKMQITLKTQGTLSKAEAIMAIETVLGMNGITVIPIGDKFAKVVPEANAPTAGGLINTNDPTALADAGKYVTQIVQLKYASPDDVKTVLQQFTKSQNSFLIIPSTSTVVLRDYTENVKRMLDMLAKIDVPTPLQVKPEVIKIKYALADDIATVLTSLGGGGGVSVGKSSAQSGFTPGFAGNTGMNSGYPGQSSYSNPSLSGNPMNSPATSARSSFQNNLQRVVRSAGAGAGAGDFQLFAETKIIADERTNSLLVFANDQDMATIKDIISKLDIVLAQVLIEAIIMEVSLGNDRDIGISYLQDRTKVGNARVAGGLNNTGDGAKGILNSLSGGGTNGNSVLGALPSGFSYFAKLNNSFDIALTAIQSDSRVNVLSRPRIQTSHAVPADLFIGDTVPYVTGTYYGGGYGGNNSQYTQKEVGIRLQVLPLINPEGLVVMDIQQDIEQIGRYIKIDTAEVPTTTKRQAGAKVAVHDGETIILGGFISATRSKSHSGIPWLMNLPGVGALFRSNSDKNDRVELIVLLRPTVLPTPEIAAAVAATERDKMSGVKQAELDLRDDERKRNEAIELQLRKEAEQKAKKAKADAKRGKQTVPEPVHAWDEAPKPTQPASVEKAAAPVSSAADGPQMVDLTSTLHNATATNAAPAAPQPYYRPRVKSKK